MDNPQKKRGLSNLLEILLLIGMVAVLAVLVSLPWTIPALTGQHPGMEGNWFYKHLTVLLAVSYTHLYTVTFWPDTGDVKISVGTSVVSGYQWPTNAAEALYAHVQEQLEG